MKKILFFAMVLIASQAFSQTSLPIDFETGPYTYVDFDGGVTSLIDNPNTSGNTSAKVAQTIKSAGEVWGGFKIELSDKIDFSTNQVFTMKVYSPRVGANVLFKLEGIDNSVATSYSTSTTVANTWETLSFDFTGSTSDLYYNIVIIFDNGTMGDGTANYTYLFDDIQMIPSDIPVLTLPIDFEEGPYGFQNFDGGTATVIANPVSGGINTSANVAQMIRNGGQPWAGSKLILDSKIDFSTNNAIKMKFYSSRTNVPLTFKLEGDEATQVTVYTTVANQWETLVWDFTGKPSNTYNALVFIFDFADGSSTLGDGTENSIFWFDDIELFDKSGGKTQIDLPVTFEEWTTNYELTDFEGGLTELVADPTNASNTVAKTIREAGTAPWAGTTIGTALGFASRIPFTASNTKLSVRVYSPTAGTPVLLKVEDHTNGALTAETFTSTTVANAWETLVFDFSNVAAGTNPFNLSTNFDKVSLMFNKGVTPTGDTYYWDDVLFVENGTTAIYSTTSKIANIFSNNRQLFVNTSEELLNGNIEVYNLMGTLVAKSVILGMSEQLNIRSKGMLIIRISDSSNHLVTTKKMIVD